MNTQKNIWKQIEKGMLAAVFALTLFYVGLFIYLNLTQYMNHVDSDMAAEALLAKEMWKAKALIPSNWYTSTERRLLSTSLLGSLFYGMTKNTVLSIGLSCTAFMAFIIAGYCYFVKQLSISKISRMIGLLLIFAFPANCILTEGQSLPYFTYLFFLFAGYYAPMGAFLFFTLGFYCAVLGKKAGKRSLLAGTAVLALISFMLGCSGMRTAEMVLMPLLIVDIIRLYRRTGGFQKFPCMEESMPTIVLFLLMIGNFVGMMLPLSVEYETKFVSTVDMIDSFFKTVLPSFLTAFGLTGGDTLKSGGGLLQLCIYAIMLIVIYSFWVILKEKGDGWNIKKEMLIVFPVSLLLSVFLLTITMISASANYFFAVTFMVAVSMSLLMEWLGEKHQFLKTVLTGFLIFYSVLNIFCTYLPSLQPRTSNQECEEVIDFMEENGYLYGYAEFWDANKITMLSKEEVTVAPVTNIATLEPYLWLTSKENFPPVLPTTMDTAYILRKNKQADFEGTLELHPGLEKRFENDKYVVYAGNLNYAIIFPEIEEKQGRQMAGPETE